MKKYRIGYTQGVYDMFHIGHLNLLNRAKEQCEYLIVGVNSDELVQSYKHKIPVIPAPHRAEIVRNIKAVDEISIVSTLDKEELWEQLRFNAIFIGDDWKGSQRWIETQKQMSKHLVDVVFLPHTPDISSSELKPQHEKKVEE